ncbi:MAG: Rab family GTPase [Acidobacteriota bacterium]|nr:Rab family GTPase [Acidobacteriota bacterium]
MIKKKICLLGSFSVGKTSLIKQFVHGIFSEKYLTTVGVKIDRKQVETAVGSALLLIWDLNGADRFQTIRSSYLAGSSGFLLVVDGTRPATLEVAVDIAENLDRTMGPLPRILLLNKWDLRDEWSMPEEQISKLRDMGWQVLKTSAKTGEQVEEAFRALTEAMLRKEGPER